MYTDLLKNKKPDDSKISNLEFRRDHYLFETKIMNDFLLQVSLYKEGKIKTDLIDTTTNEPYTLYKTKDAKGKYVASIRNEIEKVIVNLIKEYYKEDLYSSCICREIIHFVNTEYGDELEFLWKNSNNAVFRKSDTKKWYAALLKIPRSKLGLESDEMIEIINVKTNGNIPVDNKSIFKGYHMNKKTWVSIVLDGSIPVETIIKYIKESYRSCNE